MVTIVHENSERAYSHVLAAATNACISLLNQCAIAQKEAPCAAMTVAYAPQTRIMRTDHHSPQD